MKRFLLTGLLIALVFTIPSYAGDCKENKKEIQGYKVTITVIYEDITLQDLAKKENEIKKVFNEAKVNIEFVKNCPSCPSQNWQYLLNDTTVTMPIAGK